VNTKQINESNKKMTLTAVRHLWWWCSTACSGHWGAEIKNRLWRKHRCFYLFILGMFLHFWRFFKTFIKKTLGRKFQPETIMRNIVHNFVSLLWWFFSAFSIAVFH